jgi:hypothetical protein
MMAFNVGEDILNVDFVVTQVRNYSAGLCEIAVKLLTYEPGNGESLLPPSTGGGLY